MKIILLLAFLFGHGGDSAMGVGKHKCVKTLETSACTNCASIMTIKCITGTDFQTCESTTTYDCQTPSGKWKKCSQANAGNTCDHQMYVE